PGARRARSSRGSRPAAENSSRFSDAASRVGASAISHSTTRMDVAEVDHGSDTATAVASPSATSASRMRRFTAAASGLRSNMVVADLGRFPQHRKAALRLHAIARQHLREPRLVLRQLGAVGLRVPEMDDAGREPPVLAAHAGMQQPDQQVGILAAPAAKAAVESVDPLEVGAPDREIAGARVAPSPRSELAER